MAKINYTDINNNEDAKSIVRPILVGLYEFILA